jgi:hypothetical protein
MKQIDLINLLEELRKNYDIPSNFAISIEDLEKKAKKNTYSCGYNALKRTNTYPSYIKKGIKYKLPMPKKLYKKIKQNYPLLWRDILKYTILEMVLGSDYAMTFARIDHDWHYEFSNIEIKSKAEHMEEDNAKGVLVFTLPINLTYGENKNLMLKPAAVHLYKSQTEAGEAIGMNFRRVNEYVDSGRIAKTNKGDFLLMSHGERRSIAKNKKDFIQQAKAIINAKLNDGRSAEIRINKINYESYLSIIMLGYILKYNTDILNNLLEQAFDDLDRRLEECKDADKVIFEI